MTTTPDLTSQETAAAALVALYDRKWDLLDRNAEAERLTVAHIEDVITAGDELDRACAAFKARFYPRRAGWVCVGLRMVFLVNRRGQVQLYDGGTRRSTLRAAAAV